MKAYYHSKYAFEIRGPLTTAQFEKERRESYEEGAEKRRRVYGHIAEFEDSEAGSDCARIIAHYEEGDELYFFTSNEQGWSHLEGMEGYVLMRKDEIVDGFVTKIQ